MPRAHVGALVAALLVTGVTQRADALSCTPCGWVDTPRVLDALPENFEIRFAGDGNKIAPETPVLAATGTASVALTCTRIAHLDGFRFGCRPATPLVAGTTYNLTYPSWFTSMPVRVAAAADHTAPEAPSLTGVTRVMETDAQTFPNLPRTGFLIALDSAEPLAVAGFEVGVTPAGGAESIFVGAAQSAAQGAEVFLGFQGCTCSAFSGALLEQEVAIRVRVIDAAGNVGPWSTAVESEPPALEADGGCTCVGGSAAHPAGLVLALGLLAALSRRRRP
ncbi:MAG: MYXO-CTERM sorting domain-containing protein [Deltaproteobacteria bacterium]